MRTVADIVFGVTGQVLVFDAPEGRPSSVTTVEVFRWDSGDDDDAELATSGAAAVEANPNTTTDAAAGASQTDPRRIPLTSTAGIVADRTYLLIGADLLKEWTDILELDATDAAFARHPLHNDYAIGTTFVSTRMSVAIDATWAADETNLDPSAGANPMYRVRWVYVVAGVTYVADTYFNLVRYAARHGVTPENVENMRAGWLDALPVDHRRDQGRRLIDEAYREVKIDLAGVELDDAAIAESEIVDELVRFKTIERTEWSRFLASSDADQTRHKAAEEQYGKRLDSFLRLTTKVPIRDVDGSAARGSATRFTRR